MAIEASGPGRTGAAADAGPASQQGMRRQNLALVLGTLAAHGPASRAQLADRTGLTRATAGSLVGELTDAGLVTDNGLAPNGRAGRPGALLAVNQTGPAGLGLEVGVGHLGGCLIDLRGTARSWVRVEANNRGRRPQDVVAQLAAVARRVIAEGAAQGLYPAGAVLAVPGLVGTPGVVEHAPNLDWHRVPIVELLRERLPELGRGAALGVENEANLGALAELWSEDGSADFVHVSAEAGIGAALVVGGRLLRGVRGFAGELGHVPVHPDGPLCACGAHGCLEQYAGEEAVLRAAGMPDVASILAWGDERSSGVSGDVDGAAPLSPAPAATPVDPVQAMVGRAVAGDDRVREALDQAGGAMGTALAGAVNLLDPAVVILGGAYADLSAWLLPGIRRELAARVTLRAWDANSLVVSRLGRRGPLLGAALSTVRGIIEDPWQFSQPRTQGSTIGRRTPA
ncbi:MAG TPA: ROK family transcriptional regulator [Actinocrinis sp.]|nr:ROK family transcriptional regulator [Actinocrinis sp.]